MALMDAYVTGFTVGLSLIMAIGSQNAFVLRQGLRGDHIAIVCGTCAVSDALLVLLGVTGFKTVIADAPWLKPVMLYAGAGFLIWYGVKSIRSAFASTAVSMPTSRTTSSRAGTLGTCLALTWLNPHVYLDTVLLVGSISTRFVGHEGLFALGAMTASTIFFFSLGYGAAALRPLFETPMAWRVLDGVVAVTMWVIACEFLLGAAAGGGRDTPRPDLHGPVHALSAPVIKG